MASGPTYPELATAIRGTLRILRADTNIFLLKFRSPESNHVRLLNRLEKCLDNLVCMVEYPSLPPSMVRGAINQSLITFDIDHIQKTLGKMRSIRPYDLQTYVARIKYVCNVFRYIIEQQTNF